MNKSIKVISVDGIENAYIVVSCRKSKDDSLFGTQIKTNMSFMWANKDGGAEWEPEYGPITVLTPCEKDHKDAQEHWYYPYYTGRDGWSQTAVEECGLQESFLHGNYEHIFSVLKDWANSNNN